jgi:hypothetical protein
MKHRILIFMPAILFALWALPLTPVQAQTKPEVIKVGIYLIRAGSLDITTGAIDVDFYIEFACPGDCGDKTDFEILNGTFKSKPTLLADEDSATNPTFRVAATVFQRVDLRQYPFDSHEIKIVIESSNYDQTSVVYEVNEATTAIDPNVFILGWEFRDNPPQARGEIEDQYYEAWNLHYTRYIFTTELTKPALAGWLKGLLPAIIIVVGSLFALFITSKNVGNRVAIITSALVASVLYHMNFTSRVPPIGYLTYGDYFMIINYVILLISLSLTIWIIRTDAPDQQTRIARVNKLELTYVPALWLVLHVLNYVLIISGR